MSCQHKWDELDRRYCGGDQVAWCELCGTLKFTTRYEGDRVPCIVFRTPKASELGTASNSASPKCHRCSSENAEFRLCQSCVTDLTMNGGRHIGQ